jgi:hypothetical protein
MMLEYFALKLGEICSAIEGSNMRFNYDVTKELPHARHA